MQLWEHEIVLRFPNGDYSEAFHPTQGAGAVTDYIHIGDGGGDETNPHERGPFLAKGRDCRAKVRIVDQHEEDESYECDTKD